MEVCSKLFPELQGSLNVFVIAGLDKASIKKLMKQKESDNETFILLCAVLDKRQAKSVIAST